LWEAWKLSKAYRTRPSDLYGITDEVTAWCFDRAVWVFGSTLESELSEAQHSSKKPQQAMFKQMQVLKAWGLGEMKFRDPAVGSKKDDKPKDVRSDQVTGPVQL
jgi:hypothetical protein